MTLKEIRKSEPKSIPIGEYDRIFGFMKINKMPEDDESKKQAYLQAYRLRVFVYYSWVPIAISLFVYYASKFSSDRGLVSQWVDGILYAFWHWGPPKDDNLLYIRVCGATSLSWAIWMIWRLYHDIMDRGVFIREEIEDAFTKIGNLSAVSLFGSLFLFTFATIGPVDFPSLEVPSAHDSIYMYAFKKCAMISSGYWLLGFSSLLMSTCIRWARRRK